MSERTCRSERQGSRLRLIIIALLRRRAILCLVLHGGRSQRQAADRDRERKRGRPAIAFVMGYVVDREACRIIIDNGPSAVRVGDSSANWVAKVNAERFVSLNIRIAIHRYSDLFGCLTRKKRQGGGSDRRVVRRGGRCTVDSCVIHLGIERRAAGLCDRKDIGSSAAVAFAMRYIVDRECRRRIVFRNG